MATTPTSQELIDSVARWTRALEDCAAGRVNALLQLAVRSWPPPTVVAAHVHYALTVIERGIANKRDAWAAATKDYQRGNHAALAHLVTHELAPCEELRRAAEIAIANPTRRRRAGGPLPKLNSEQAAMVRVLYEAHRMQFPELTEGQIHERLAARFGVKVHPIRAAIERSGAYARTVWENPRQFSQREGGVMQKLE